MVEAHHHRPTLKQQNKPFKSKHASKSSLKEVAKGRIPRQSPKASPTSANIAAQKRLNRRNNAKQSQITKHQALVSATRIFSGVDGAPRIVAVVPLSPDVSARSAIRALTESLQADSSECPEHGLWKLRADRFKTSLQFINLSYGQLYATLDACKAADYVLFVLSPSVEVDSRGDVLFRTLQAQGLPDVISVVPPSSTTSDVKTRYAVLKSLLSFVRYFVPSHARVFDLDVDSDRTTALRAMCEGKPTDVRWREGRSWLVAEEVRWKADSEGGGSGTGTLSMTGVVRGAQLSANRLVHLPNFGDFQISGIFSAPSQRASKSGHTSVMDVEPALLAEPDPSSADSLVSSNDPDDLANEQTWPTEDEMRDADSGIENVMDHNGALPDAGKGTTPRAVRRIPKGMSEYQAAWIIDEEEEEDTEVHDDSIDAEDPHVLEEVMEEMVELPQKTDHDLEMDLESKKSIAFMDLDLEEEDKQLETWRAREREEENDHTFPDEIDTPKDIPARVRFQRYRGLRSFRTSPWDPFENLPRDYARIFQFEDFKRTERGVRRRAEQDSAGIEPGMRVTVLLKNVPENASMTFSQPLTLFGLLQHEHKTSVLNFTVQRNTENEEIVRSKDSLVLCVGPRRFRTNPIFSQHTSGGGKGSNNVHKFERFLRHGVTSVATTYGPVIFGHQPCVLLRETEDKRSPQLVATGSFLNTDTTRIIAKRLILTGHPFKVHRKTATVRYMFFNADDVMYFAPIQLHTKHGRTGHIRESLGTHGYFKAHFDAPVTQMDTVCMNLYKRVYPKWCQLWRDGINIVQTTESRQDDGMEE